MEIFVANEQAVPVDEARIASLANHALATEELPPSAELSVLLVTEAHIRELNARFAGDDYATDVLSFPMLEEEESGDVLGDVVICPAVAGSGAQRLGHSLDDEMDVLLVHGILHLLGYDHQTDDDRVRMDARLREIVRSFAAASG